MSGFSSAASAAIRNAMDGDEPLRFERLPLEPPETVRFRGTERVIVKADSLAALAERAFGDMQFYPRESLVRDLVRLAAAPDAGERGRFVLQSLIENAATASQGRFPLCQDTGTATVYGWKGQDVCVEGGDDEEALARGASEAWRRHRLRNSQVAPLSLYDERNTGDNSPLAAELFSCPGDAYRFLFIAKGGGSSNKTALFQETKALLKPSAFEAFLAQAIGRLGVSACPPYRIALAIGGQSPEEALLAAKLASCGALDALPRAATGNTGGVHANGVYRDAEAELLAVRIAERSGWGAQFGGPAMARDTRVVRLPRHAASLPVALAVSCVAHRQAVAYADRTGFYLERLARAEDICLIRASAAIADGPVDIGASTRRLDLAYGMEAPRDLKAGDMVTLHGPVVLARDAAHSRLAAMLERGEELPDWTRYPVFYASPTETPEGAVMGSIGPTTSRRMDSYAGELLSRGAFPVMLGKGERAPAFAEACARHGGLYLAAVGGAAALASSRYVRSQTLLDWPELGMEAIRLVEFDGLPALVAVDASGGDFYRPMAASR